METNTGEYTIRPYRWMWIWCVICIISNMLFFIIFIAFLCIKQLNTFYMLLPIAMDSIMLAKCIILFKTKIIISEWGVELSSLTIRKHKFEWSEFNIAYFMRVSYIYTAKFVFLSNKEVPEKRRMIMASWSQIGCKRHTSWVAFAIKHNDIEHILKLLGENVFVINEL